MPKILLIILLIILSPAILLGLYIFGKTVYDIVKPSIKKKKLQHYLDKIAYKSDPYRFKDELNKTVFEQMATMDIQNRLPMFLSIQDLTRTTGLSEIKVRKALQNLINEGLVLRHPHNKTYVISHKGSWIKPYIKIRRRLHYRSHKIHMDCPYCGNLVVEAIGHKMYCRNCCTPLGGEFDYLFYDEDMTNNDFRTSEYIYHNPEKL